MSKQYDYIIVGAGLVGLACAFRLKQRDADLNIAVIEKEQAVAQHQSGRNSGVIHAGVYYAPGSLKAQLCKAGLQQTKAFCDAYGIAYENTGKLIVASDSSQLGAMQTLYKNAQANQINIKEISAEIAQELEPNIRCAGALLSPDTAIVDYAKIAQTMQQELVSKGVAFYFNNATTAIKETTSSVEIKTNSQSFSAKRAIFCAGLYADKLAQMAGLKTDFIIVPFRGEYFKIEQAPKDLVSHLIYPVPDAARPFLGVHITRKMNGDFTVGPNAVLAFAREGYHFNTINFKDIADYMQRGAFWHMLKNNAGTAIDELKSAISRRYYLTKVQQYCQQIELHQLTPYRAGVRAQALDLKGNLIQDFKFLKGKHSLHVCNAPSPAATSCLPIADYILGRITS